jgi:RNA polymerase sigma-B factor
MAACDAHRADKDTGQRPFDADRALFARLADQRDPVDREIVVERFLPLARSLAARYQRRGEPFEDVFQVACIGLVNAIDRYDISRGRAFSSFAVPTIVGEIKRYYRDRTWSLRVPRDLKDLTLAVEGAYRDFESEHARSPTVGEIAERIGADEEEIVEALQARHARRSDSLDAPRYLDDGPAGTVGEQIPVDDPGFAKAEDRADLRTLIGILSPRERIVLRLRFEYDLTQQEIGERIGISQMQISRILRAAIERLRAYHEQHAARLAA